MSEPSALLALVGRMKVEQLACLVGLTVQDVIATVLGAVPVHNQTPASHGSGARPTEAAHTASAHGEEADQAPTSTPAAPGEPPLAALFGRATYRDIHRAIDGWLIPLVLDQEHGNVSRASQRLVISRRTLRKHLDRARGLRIDTLLASGAHGRPRPPAPEPPSLTGLLTQGRSYIEIRDTVDRWLLGSTLDREHDNVSRAARSLGLSRKVLRERWARLDR